MAGKDLTEVHYRSSSFCGPRQLLMTCFCPLQEVVGKDLTKVCLPVYFNEPLSALQKMAEELEYSELVDQVPPPFVCCSSFSFCKGMSPVLL